MDRLEALIRLIHLAIASMSFLNFTITGYYLKMISEGQVKVVSRGDSVDLECLFHADDYSFFEHPVVWTKQQLQQQTSINLAGNINEPFLQTNRYEVELTMDPPRYKFDLRILDLEAVDIGNYTCEIRGAKSTLLAHSSTKLNLRSPILSMYFFDDRDFPSRQEESSQSLHSLHSTPHHPSFTSHPSTLKRPRLQLFRFVEGVPGKMGCLCVGGYPLQPFKLSLDHRDISHSFHLSHPSFTIGNSTGLNTVVYRAQLWSSNLTLSARDDQKKVVCSASVPGLYTSRIEGIVDVVYRPKITCTPTTAHLYEKNVHISCVVRSKPHYIRLYWNLEQQASSSSSPTFETLESLSSSPPHSATLSSSSSASSSSSSLTTILSTYFSNSNLTASLKSSPTHLSPSPFSSLPLSSSASTLSSSTPPHLSSTLPTFTLTSGSHRNGMWSVMSDRPGGVTEVQLFFGEVTAQTYKHYVLVAENVIGVSKASVPLLAKDKLFNTQVLSDASVSQPGHVGRSRGRGGGARMNDIYHNASQLRMSLEQNINGVKTHARHSDEFNFNGHQNHHHHHGSINASKSKSRHHFSARKPKHKKLPFSISQHQHHHPSFPFLVFCLALMLSGCVAKR